MNGINNMHLHNQCSQFMHVIDEMYGAEASRALVKFGGRELTTTVRPYIPLGAKSKAPAVASNSKNSCPNKDAGRSITKKSRTKGLFIVQFKNTF